MVPFGQPCDNGLDFPLSTLLVSRPCLACFKVLPASACLCPYLASLAYAQKGVSSSQKKSDRKVAFFVRFLASDLVFRSYLQILALAYRSTGLYRFKQTCSPLAAADAHGHNTVLLIAALEFTQDRSCLTRAGHAEWMAN